MAGNPLGISDESFKSSGIESVIEQYANIASERLRTSLEQKQLPGTQRLLWQSLYALPTKIEGNKITADVNALKYWQFINYGVQGVGGNMADGRAWVKKSPNSPFKFKEGKKPPVSALRDWAYLANKSPFALRETIYRQGIKANNFLEDAINDKFIQEFSEAVSKAMSKIIEVDIKTDFDGK